MTRTNLDTGNLRRDYRRFAAPTVVSLTVFSLYSMVDGIFVGRYLGPTALAAVNLGAPFLNGLFSVAVLLAVGAGTLIASRLGHGDSGTANVLFSQNLAVAAAAGLAAAALSLVFLTPLCRLLGAAEDTLADTRAYVGALAPFAAFIVLEYNLEVLIKTDGHPAFAMGTVLCACVLHAGLDWLLLDRLGMDVRGAALATGISETFAALLLLGHFLFGKRHTLRLTRFRFDAGIYRRLVPIGVPDGAAELCNGVMTWLFNRVILRLIGTAGVASFTVITYVNTLMMNCFIGTSQGMQPLVSFHGGRGDEAACRKLLRCAQRAEAILAAAAFAALTAGAGAVVSVFLPDRSGALWAQSVRALRCWSFSFLVMGFNIVAAGYLTARERPRGAIAVSLGRGFVLQAAALGVLTRLFGGGGIWFATLAGELVCAGLSAVLLRREARTA